MNDSQDKTVFGEVLSAINAGPSNLRQLIRLPGDGEPAYALFTQPDPMMLQMPLTMELPKPEPMQFMLGQMLGGVDVRPSPLRFITVTELPMPRAPGVAAMLADGWVWTGWHFARYRAGRYAEHICDRRVLAGRYAGRLPTNRKRKRERAKARRRERLR